MGKRLELILHQLGTLVMSLQEDVFGTDRDFSPCELLKIQLMLGLIR